MPLCLFWFHCYNISIPLHPKITGGNADVGFKRGGLSRQNPPTQVRGWQKISKHWLRQATANKTDGFPSPENHAFMLARGYAP